MLENIAAAFKLGDGVLLSGVSRPSAVRNAIKEPPDTTGDFNVENGNGSDIPFFICKTTVKRSQGGFSERWNPALATAQPDTEFASHTQRSGGSCQSGPLSRKNRQSFRTLHQSRR